MFGSMKIDLRGIDAIGQVEKAAEMNIVRTLNRAADRGRTGASRLITGQIAFPKGYLDPGQGRLVVAQRAMIARPQAIIRARERPTQLSRFRTGDKTVMVRPGQPVTRERFFILNLKSGNVGIAVRLRKGASVPEGAKRRQRGKDTWEQRNNLMILYGPSVDQVFRRVRGELVPDLSSFMQGELVRLMSLKELR